jgi:penicillin G amidase
MITDLGKFNNSLAIHNTGHSGQAFHRHYTDMVEPWRKIQYHPLFWDLGNIASNTKSTLLLIP